MMARPKNIRLWAEEVQLWDLRYVKQEPALQIPANYEFSKRGELVTVIPWDGKPEAGDGKWISDHRVRQSRKRFDELDFAEWSSLPNELQTVHPKCQEYQQERRRLAALEREPSTPIQRKAWELCQVRNHDWMMPHTRFEGVAFENSVWFEGVAVIQVQKCYFCGEEIRMEDPGGAPFFPG